MLTRDNIEERLRESFPHLAQEYGVDRVGLFGSFVQGTADEASDVDMVVEFRQPIGLRFVEMVEYLEQLFGRRVDVLTPEGLRSIRVGDVADNIAGSVRYVHPH